MVTILIVEDDIQLQDIYKRKLTKEGYNVLLAGNAQDGLQAAKTGSPSLILLDLMLPGGQNGFDILEQIKRDQSMANIPVIILTNLDGEQQSAMAIGAADYIIKANTSLDQMMVKVKTFTEKK